MKLSNNALTLALNSYRAKEIINFENSSNLWNWLFCKNFRCLFLMRHLGEGERIYALKSPGKFLEENNWAYLNSSGRFLSSEPYLNTPEKYLKVTWKKNTWTIQLICTSVQVIYPEFYPNFTFHVKFRLNYQNICRKKLASKYFFCSAGKSP